MSDAKVIWNQMQSREISTLCLAKEYITDFKSFILDIYFNLEFRNHSKVLMAETKCMIEYILI